jgi:hypothetical protein
MNVTAPRALISFRRRGRCFTLSRSCSGSGRQGRLPQHRRRAVFPRSRPTLPSCTAAGRRLPGLCCPRPSTRSLRSILRRSRVSAASEGEKAPAPERAQTVSAGRSRRTYRTSCAVCIPYSAGMHFASSCFWFPISSFARATSIFHLHLICLHPFVLVPSLPLLLAFPFKKFALLLAARSCSSSRHR